MERVLLSRQPISRVDLSVIGYELLFRDSDVDKANIRDNDEATAQVVVNSLMEIGLDRMVGSGLAFINTSRNFLLSDFCDVLPPTRVVLELLEPPELDRGLLSRLDQLIGAGYRIATGDFVFKSQFQPLLERTHLFKLDMLSSDGLLQQHLDKASQYPAQLVAEKVETTRQFEICKSYGFHYFQGYFFCRPEFIQAKRLPLGRLATLRLIAKLNEPELDIDELESAIRQDISLSYKLLKFVGSAAVGVRRNITSIRHAAVLTGIDRLKIWASLILFSGIEDGKKELTMTAVTRARMCERLAEAMNVPGADQFFLVGLFSVLDAMLDQPLPSILESLQLSPPLVNALIRYEGVLGETLQCVQAYERRAWMEVRCGGLDNDAIREAYVKAMAWSIQTLSGFSDSTAEGQAPKEAQKKLRRSTV